MISSLLDQFKALSFIPDKNFLLRDFQRADRLFRGFSMLPKALRSVFVEKYVRLTMAKTQGRTFPDRMTLFLTNQCNMKCAHCFIVKDKQPILDEMGLDDYRKLFASVAGKVSQILLTGGEPTLRKDCVDIVVSASRDGRIPTINLFSNGLRDVQIADIVEQIISRCDIRINFQTSVDGLEVFHDKNRRVPGALNMALATVRRILALKKKHPQRVGRVIATTAISRSNLAELDRIIDLAVGVGAAPAFAFVRSAENGVFNLSDPALLSDFSPEDTRSDGTPKFSIGDFLTVEDMNRGLETIDRKLWSKHPDNLVYAYNRVTLETIRDSAATNTTPLTQECRMGFDDIVILPDGLVSRCEMLAAGANLRDFEFDVPALMSSLAWGGYLSATAGCWCTHDCGIGVSIMKEPAQIMKLVR